MNLQQPKLTDEELDQEIRHALLRDVDSAEPPERGWQHISRQVAAGPALTQRQPLTSPLNPLMRHFMQGLAAAAVLLLVGLSLGPDLWVGSYRFGTRETLVQPQTPVVISEPTRSVPDAVQENNTIAIVVFEAEDDILSTGVLLRLRQAEPEERLIAPLTLRPELDPVLVNRHNQPGK